jgi:starch-binding outer membrane protein, SusD/RagB family
MKVNKILIIVISLIIFIFSGCEEQVFDKKPEDVLSDKDVWNDISLVENYVWNIYNYLGSWDFDGQPWYEGGQTFLFTVTDLGFMNWDRGTYMINRGELDPANLGVFSNRWKRYYEGIRKCNIFLNRVDDVPKEEEGVEKLVKRLKGEVKFIRAHLYAKLTSYFGGVPLITKVFELQDDFKTERNSYEECINFIVKELNESEDMVPLTVSSDNFGRITKGACCALKSEVLLYAASKLHDPGTEPSGSLYDYNNANKWQEAANAAKAVIDMEQYSLVEVDNWKDYQHIFLENNSEIILARPYSREYSGQDIDKVNSPNGYNGWSGNLPLHNLVRDFEMKNGMMPGEPGSGFEPDTTDRYKNRDPRLYADIIYQGCEFRGREVEMFLPGGKDSKDGIMPWNTPETGYCIRKFLDESFDFDATKGRQPWIFFRLAEIYLNYAEAQYYIGNEDIARKYVNKVRSRVGMPAINTSGQQLIEDIRHERKIELCFEEHRYFDIRRWMIGENVGNYVAEGIEWKKLDKNGDLSPNGTLQSKIIIMDKRKFFTRNYYLPIPKSEIEKSDLKQNWGYD